MIKDTENKSSEALEEEEISSSKLDEAEDVSKKHPSQSEISDIMQDIKTAVIDEAKERKVLEVSSTKRSAFLLTKDMQVNRPKSNKENLSMSMEELERLIRRIVVEEIKKLEK
tara:strand:- start:2001 stop:2339 length:339 start_codon:yes stop_codon:yes gene_type:complete